LRVLRHRDAVERGTDDRVLELLSSERHLALSHLHLVARGREPRGEGIALGLGDVQGAAALDPRLRELAHAPELQLRLTEPHRELVLRARGRDDASLRMLEGAARVRVVEAREHLALLDGHALLDGNLDETPGDLGRHRRLTPRDDVARRVEHRRRGAARARLGDHGRLHLRGGRAAEEPPRGDGDEHDREPEQKEAPPPRILLGALGAIDAQLLDATPLGGHEMGERRIPTSACRRSPDPAGAVPLAGRTGYLEDRWRRGSGSSSMRRRGSSGRATRSPAASSPGRRLAFSMRSAPAAISWTSFSTPVC
jgi:hypothetical protein